MNDSSLTTSQWLKQAITELEKAGIGTARLDSLVLLEDVTSKDRTHLLAHPGLELTSEQQNLLQELLARRSQHEPLAYIRGQTEFYGRKFIITHDVLEPRPESETMIELFKELRVKNEGLRIIDVGTGSGALAITAKLEMPNSTVCAIDIDINCLNVAKQNAKKHDVDIEFIQNDLFKNSTLPASPLTLYVLANLPYVPDDYQINEAALQEPRIAIFGGKDGLELYRDMFSQLTDQQVSDIFVFTESLPFQHRDLASIATKHNFIQIAEEDFIQVFKSTL